MSATKLENIMSQPVVWTMERKTREVVAVEGKSLVIFILALGYRKLSVDRQYARLGMCLD